MSFSYEDADIPAGGVPNPHLEVVKGLQIGSGAKRIRLSADSPEKLEKALSSTKRQLSEAGAVYGVTVRKVAEVADDKLSATVTFWTVERIVHKDSKASGVAAPAEPASAAKAPAAPKGK